VSSCVICVAHGSDPETVGPFAQAGTNRAQCHKKKGAWEQVLSDCAVALQLDNVSIKAYYLSGAAMVQQGNFAEGITRLDRALQLCKERTVSYKDDIRRAMLAARKQQWEAGSGGSIAALEECERALPALISAGYAQHAGGSALEAQVLQGTAEALSRLRAVRAPSRVPDYLCCKISMELMLDPVVTPSGVSYERSYLVNHLQKVGAFDPVSREPLGLHQLHPNLALKEAVELYLEERPWAYESNL